MTDSRPLWLDQRFSVDDIAAGMPATVVLWDWSFPAVIERVIANVVAGRWEAVFTVRIEDGDGFRLIFDWPEITTLAEGPHEARATAVLTGTPIPPWPMPVCVDTMVIERLLSHRLRRANVGTAEFRATTHMAWLFVGRMLRTDTSLEDGVWTGVLLAEFRQALRDVNRERQRAVNAARDAARTQMAQRAGAFTVNELRAQAGLDAVEGGNVIITRVDD